MKSNLRIAINAQLPTNSGTGGIETVLRILTFLGRLKGSEEYVFIGHWSDADWLKPLLNAGQKLVYAPKPEQSKILFTENFKQVFGRLRPVMRKIKHAFKPLPRTKFNLPVSNGFYESLNCDVIHFPYQDYVCCNLPTVYNPHDLQHLHYPQFFTSDEIERRETIYPAACRAAQKVVAASQFVKQDIIQNYGIEPDKIQVIQWSPPEMVLEKVNDQSAVNLTKNDEIFAEPFALYPAMTWEHKNHIRLLEAVASLRDRDNLKINLICTGHKNSFFSQIEKQLHELKLENQIKFLGIVSNAELSRLYTHAEFVIIPTLFEAQSAPMFEAWQHGTPVACSSVTSLPEQAGDAALLFNPFSVEEISNALKLMTENKNLRQKLRLNGTNRLQDFSLEHTAKAYRAVYRKVAGLNLNDEDLDLLAAKR